MKKVNDPAKKKLAAKNMRALETSLWPARKRLAVKNQNDPELRGRDNDTAMRELASKTRSALEARIRPARKRLAVKHSDDSDLHVLPRPAGGVLLCSEGPRQADETQFQEGITDMLKEVASLPV